MFICTYLTFRDLILTPTAPLTVRYYFGQAEENPTGPQKHISISHFLEFPQVEVVPPVVSQMAESDAIVVCSASGSPAPVLFWNLNTTEHPPLSTSHEVKTHPQAVNCLYTTALLKSRIWLIRRCWRTFWDITVSQVPRDMDSGCCT